jgi:hypothetical protein
VRGSIRLGGASQLASACALAFGLAAIAVLALAGAAAAGGPQAFRIADGSVACRPWTAGAIVCRGDRTPVALALTPHGDSRAFGASVPSAGARILPTGAVHRHGTILCRAAAREMVCSTPNGGQIVVGAAGLGALAPAPPTP